MLAAFAALAQWIPRSGTRADAVGRRRHQRVVLIFFVAVMVFATQPLRDASPFTPADGAASTRCCRTTGWSIHPPMLYLGYVGVAVPFAFAIAALRDRQARRRWIRATRRWTLVAWFFLSHRHPARRVVGLRGARLGRLLGVGPGRERLASCPGSRAPPSCTR